MTARHYALAVICCVVCNVGLSWAGAGTTKRHQQGAHVHGAAAVNIAIDDRTAIIELIAPADSVVGFEHQAKSAADQTRQEKALDLLRNDMDRMVVFNATLGCRFAPTKIEVVRQGEEHAEVHGTFAVSCQSPMAGSKVRFGFTRTFPGIETVNVQLVGVTQQVGASVKRDKGELEVPR
jgi:transketolase C-terminal domain/subunit